MSGQYKSQNARVLDTLVVARQSRVSSTQLAELLAAAYPQPLEAKCVNAQLPSDVGESEAAE